MGRVEVQRVAGVVGLVADKDDFEARALPQDLVLAYGVVDDPLKHHILLYKEVFKRSSYS